MWSSATQNPNGVRIKQYKYEEIIQQKIKDILMVVSYYCWRPQQLEFSSKEEHDRFRCGLGHYSSPLR